MNKKFTSISLMIFIISVIFILGFKFILGDKVLYNNAIDFDNGEPIIKYSGFEEDENIYKIRVSIKNNSDYYASFNNINLQFSYNTRNKSGYSSNNAVPIFNGYDNTEKEYLLNFKPGDKRTFSSYFGPNEEREYVFEISKGLKFDEQIFDTNSMTISYSIQYFNYRINRNTVIGSAFSRSGAKHIDASLEPFIIE